MRIHADLHSHSHYSADGISTPESMIAVAKRKGLQALAITDHNNSRSVDYLLEQGLMREDGCPVNDFLLVPGIEVTTAEGHLLCLGARFPNDLKGAPAREVCDLAHQLGALAVPPHPFDRFRSGIRGEVLQSLPIDALEVFNAATTLDRHNRQAWHYAQAHRLGMLASSDAHHSSAVGTAYSILEVESLTLSDVLRSIPSNCEIVRRYLTLKDSVRKTAANLRRLLPFHRLP